ncbi:GGDEF domain-containing protein [Deinococcus sp.]|uniref:GGDEF domain-containing protein n=1 Tax=Deinococcus sp. TaxID=47478 RepID=UPI003CC5480C
MESALLVLAPETGSQREPLPREPAVTQQLFGGNWLHRAGLTKTKPDHTRSPSRSQASGPDTAELAGWDDHQGNGLESHPGAHGWDAVKRRVFLIVGPLGSLACLLALLAQRASLDSLDAWALPSICAVLLLLSLLLALRRLGVAAATVSAFCVCACYFLLSLDHQFAWFVPTFQTLSESTYWYSVVYATAFIILPRRQALWVCLLIFGLSGAICAVHLAHLSREGTLNLRMVASVLQFLIASGVLALAQLAVGRLRQQLDQVRLAAYRDVLTGLPNRRHAQQLLDRLMSDARPFCIVMLDLDHFKRVNDTFGHQAGDLVLRETARAVRRHLSGTQLMARWGGEEFVLILPEQSKRAAKLIADRARSEVGAQRLGALERVTASFGLAERIKGDTLETLLARADSALYAAKRQGRDGVRVAMDDGRLTCMELTAPTLLPAGASAGSPEQ